MTTATQILRNEHDHILGVLEVAEEIARRMDRNEPVARETLDQVHEFLRLFADTCHHGKEEDLLFPALAARGMPTQGGPIGVMLHEHDHGRALIRQMMAAAEELAAGDSGAGGRWAEGARNYVLLLREHIYKENNILFMMAERMLSDEEQRLLAIEFDRVEKEKLGAGTHERLHALAAGLCASFLQASAGTGR